MTKHFEYSVETQFITPGEVSLLVSEFTRAFCDIDARKPAENVVELDSGQVIDSANLCDVHKKIEAYFTEILNVSGISLAKVWLVKSQPKDSDLSKLPYIPHFDKHRYLKAMVYLHDVDNDHGPIHFGKVHAPSQIEFRRRLLPPNYKELGLNTVGRSELKTDMRPILGSKGDVVFFDTNAAHCAGTVSAGFERRIIRFDFEVRGFNTGPSLAYRLYSRIRSLLRLKSHQADDGRVVRKSK